MHKPHYATRRELPQLLPAAAAANIDDMAIMVVTSMQDDDGGDDSKGGHGDGGSALQGRAVQCSAALCLGWAQSLLPCGAHS